MALRFQDKSDEVDQKVRADRHFSWWLLIFAVPYGVVAGIHSLLTGGSLARFENDLGGCLAVLFVAAMAESLLAPFYNEFRIRTKEIDGKVSAIEKALKESKESHAELLEKLIAIAEQLERQGEAELGGNGTVAHRDRISFPPDFASEYDISTAVSEAIQETDAISPDNLGLVLMAARRHLSGKRFEESELRSIVGRITGLSIADFR